MISYYQVNNCVTLRKVSNGKLIVTLYRIPSFLGLFDEYFIEVVDAKNNKMQMLSSPDKAYMQWWLTYSIKFQSLDSLMVAWP